MTPLHALVAKSETDRMILAALAVVLSGGGAESSSGRDIVARCLEWTVVKHVVFPEGGAKNRLPW